jgi:hypothetical protein
MTVLFNFSLQTPLTADDREIIVALSVLTHAIATHKSGEPYFPDDEDDNKEYDEEHDAKGNGDMALGQCDYTGEDGVCYLFKGHSNPHALFKASRSRN